MSSNLLKMKYYNLQPYLAGQRLHKETIYIRDLASKNGKWCLREDVESYFKKIKKEAWIKIRYEKALMGILKGKTKEEMLIIANNALQGLRL